jgi:protein-disulfide isomerase
MGTVRPCSGRAWNAAVAAACAADQKQFAPFHDLLFTSPRALDASSMANHAAAVGLDAAAYRTCLERTGPEQVAADLALAKSLGVSGTPAFFAGAQGPNQQLLVRRTIKGTREVIAFVSAVDDALTGKPASDSRHPD